MVEQHLTRGHGHPWDGRPGFDLLEVRADTQHELNAFTERAKAKFWKAWLLGTTTLEDGTSMPAGVFYKPSGILEPWKDGPENPHPGRSTVAAH